jgi:hypothetical protein
MRQRQRVTKIKHMIMWTVQKGNTGGLRQREWREVVQTETGGPETERSEY